MSAPRADTCARCENGEHGKCRDERAMGSGMPGFHCTCEKCWPPKPVAAPEPPSPEEMARTDEIADRLIANLRAGYHERGSIKAALDDAVRAERDRAGAREAEWSKQCDDLLDALRAEVERLRLDAAHWRNVAEAMARPTK